MFTEIPRIELARMPNAEFLTLMSNIKKLIERFGAGELGVSVFFAKFVELLARAMAAMETEKSSGFVTAMDAADYRRDDDYRVFYYYIKAFTFSGDQLVKESANQLMRIIRDGDNPLTAGRDKETTLLENLYNKLLPEPYTAHLDQLQARILLNTAIVSNNTYKDLYAGRTEEQSAKAPGNVKDVRIQIYPVYRGMINAINSSAAQQPESDVYSAFTSQAAVEVKHFKDLLAQHKSKKKEEGQ